ncbi:MAG: hypothetical protein ACJ0A3_01435 [Dehalococcoidia bacterium]
MLKVTDNAKIELKRLKEARTIPEGQCMKLVAPPLWVGEGDFGMVITLETDDDTLVLYEGETVLRVESFLMEQIKEVVLDFKQTPEGKQFTMDVY